MTTKKTYAKADEAYNTALDTAKENYQAAIETAAEEYKNACKAAADAWRKLVYTQICETEKKMPELRYATNATHWPSTNNHWDND